MTIPAGTRFGRYEILSPIGSGGMGEVYLAEDVKLGRRVALKFLPPDLTDNEDRRRRFEQEARAASALNHPNILTIYEIGEAEGRQFIATEFVDGASLRQQMKAGPLKIAEAIEISIQAASALSAAHDAGIVHRDVKPENIMVRRDHFAKVLDFGLAKLTEQMKEASGAEAPTLALVNTEPGVVMGTAAYMSPEQARGLQVDARTDVFSLGVVLYEMVAGRQPFEGATKSDVIAALLEREPKPLSVLAPETTPELERIVTKALAKDREDRYQTIKDMMIDLRRLKQRLEFDAELERSGQPQASSAAAGIKEAAGGRAAKSGSEAATEIIRAETTHPATSAEYLVSKAKRHKVGVAIVLAVLILSAAAFVYFFRDRQSKSKAIDSLAVLPFVNVGNDPSTEYLSDGITDSLINSLSRLPNLKVMSRNSVFRYKGRDTDSLEAARALNVRAVLTGKVIQQSDSLSISVELVDALDNSHLWGEQYNRKLSNLLAVQEEITREVSEKLRAKLTGEEERRVTKRYTDNAEAYQLYLKGRYFWNKFNPADDQKAIEFFSQAIDRDPTFALAYSGLGNAYGVAAGNSWMPPGEYYPKAMAAAKKALELDDMLAEAHSTFGAIKMFYEFDWEAAEREYRRAIELNPNQTDAYELYSYWLTSVGRTNEAIEMARRGLQTDPLSLPLSDDLAAAYYNARRYDEAIKQYQKSLEIDANHAGAYLGLGFAYEQKGMYEEAIAAYQKNISLSDRISFNLGPLGHAYAASGRKGEALKILDEMRGMAGQKYISPFDLAILYTGLGDRERALEELNRAYEERAGWLITIKVEPLFDPLRSDPRFQDILRRMKLQ